MSACWMLRLSVSTVWKSVRWSWSSSLSSTAMAVAERGSLSSRAISPKKSPGPSMDRMTSRPSSPRIVTLIRPSRIMKKKSPSSFSKNTTVSFGKRRRDDRRARLAMSPSVSSEKIGTVRSSS